MIDFLAANWPWIAVIGVFVAMHRGGHGCGMHAGHGGHAGHADKSSETGHSHTDQSRPSDRADTNHARHPVSRRSTS